MLGPQRISSKVLIFKVFITPPDLDFPVIFASQYFRRRAAGVIFGHLDTF